MQSIMRPPSFGGSLLLPSEEKQLRNEAYTETAVKDRDKFLDDTEHLDPAMPDVHIWTFGFQPLAR